MSLSMKNKKLIRINRFIEVEDLGSEKLVNEVNVSHITLDQLLQIFEPHGRGDPYLYDPYDINMEQLMQLNKYLDRPHSKKQIESCRVSQEVLAQFLSRLRDQLVVGPVER